jgi:hypothetical protein
MFITKYADRRKVDITNVPQPIQYLAITLRLGYKSRRCQFFGTFWASTLQRRKAKQAKTF